MTQKDKGFLKPVDLDNIANLLDNRLAVFATKDDLKEAVKEMKDYMHGGIETVMDGMDRLTENFAEKKQVVRLEI